MPIDAGRAFEWAWRVLPRLPESVVRGAFDAAFRIAARAQSGGAAQLGRNLARIRPSATDAELRRLVQQGMREYGRYYAETFLMPKYSRAELAARVRLEESPDAQRAVRDMANGSVVLALGHTGNWESAAAWVNEHASTVLTVAERLTPDSLFSQFLAFRESLGMEVLPLGKGEGGAVFRELLRRTSVQPRATCLLADRDLGRSGIEVDLAGEPVRVAPGPASLALALGIPLYYVGTRSAKVTVGGRSRWGIDLVFRGPLEPPANADSRSAAVAGLTQRWVNELGGFITESPASWHMLQKVFVADLDRRRP